MSQRSSVAACYSFAADPIFSSVNIPWPTKGMTDADYIYSFIRIVMPIAYEFAPELVISEPILPEDRESWP